MLCDRNAAVLEESAAVASTYAVRREQRNAYREIVGPDRTVERATENWLTGTVDGVLATLAA